MFERDGEVHGKSPNAKMFLVISMATLEWWIQKRLRTPWLEPAPVVGVGTLAGGRLPAFRSDGVEIKDPGPGDVPA